MLAICQVAVNCTYAEHTIAWPIPTRQYPPNEWITDAACRTRTQAARKVSAQTKREIALGLLDEAVAWGVRHACVVCDAGYGDDPPLLASLEARRERYFAAILIDSAVAASCRCEGQLI
jgi:SRSO17 transposase